MIKYIYINISDDADKKLDRLLTRDFIWGINYITEYISRDIAKEKYKYKKINKFIIEVAHKEKNLIYEEVFKCLTYNSTFSIEKILSLTELEFRKNILELLNVAAQELDRLIPGIKITIEDSISSFREGGYKNIWLFKKRRIAGIGTAKLICELTTFEFTLTLVVENKAGDELYSKILFTENPDSFFYYPKFKDLKVTDKNILICDRQDYPSFKIPLSDVITSN